jgi:hypothetical protein
MFTELKNMLGKELWQICPKNRSTKKLQNNWKHDGYMPRKMMDNTVLDVLQKVSAKHQEKTFRRTMHQLS